MAYVPATSDPKFTSVQSFRTSEAIYVRVASKEIHGWDKLEDISFSNKTVNSYIVDNKRTTSDGFKIYLLKFDVEVASRVNSAVGRLTYMSGVVKTLTVYFDVSELPTTFGELIFDDNFESGTNTNTYGYNCAISSKSLRNSLRTFVYPSASKDPKRRLDPSKDANQYYISNSATILYVASSTLQNAYFKSKIKTQASSADRNEYGYFIGGMSSQQLDILCSAGNKNDKINIIKGHVVAYNLKKIESTSKYYSVCTQSFADNYYRTSPYPDCDGTNLSATIIDHPDSIFVEGGCCETSRTVSVFDITAVVTDPTDQDTDGGLIEFTWDGGLKPYFLAGGCPSGSADPTCVSFSIETSNEYYTWGSLSGASEGRYSYTLRDSHGNIISEYTTVAAAMTPDIIGCRTAGALNYDSDVSTTGENADLCRWCNSTTGLLTDEAGDTALDPFRTGTDTFVTLSSNILEPTITATDALATASDGIINLSWEWNPVTIGEYVYNLQDSDLFDQEDGTEKFVVSRKTLTSANFDSAEPLHTVWATGTSETSFDLTDLASLDSSITSVPLGYYIYKIQYADSLNGGTFTDCAAYHRVKVTVTGCQDVTAANYLNGDAGLIIADNDQCIAGDFSAISFNDLVNTDYTLSTELLTHSGAACSYFTNLIYEYEVDMSGYGITATGGTLNSSYIFFAYPIMEIIRAAIEESSGNPVSLGEISLINATYDATYVTAVEGYTEQFTVSDENPYYQFSINPTQVITLGTQFGNISSNVGVTQAIVTLQFAYNGEYIGEEIVLSWPVGPDVGDPTYFSFADITNSVVEPNLCAACEDGMGDIVQGCTSPFSCNYNSEAVLDDGSCIDHINPPVGAGGEVVEINNFYDGGILDITIDGVNYPQGNPCGCDTPDTFNFDPVAAFYTAANGGIPYGFSPDCGNPIVSGCMDSAWSGYDPLANVHNQDDCGSQNIIGCTDNTACNYNSSATSDDGLCWYSNDLNCDSFGSWEITSFTPPIICNGDNTTTGSLTITNSTYTGPFSFYIDSSAAGSWVNNITGTSNILEVQGLNPDSTAGTISYGDMVGDQSSINVLQTSATGTTITFTGVGIGFFNLNLAYFYNPDAFMWNVQSWNTEDCNCGFEEIAGPGGDYMTIAYNVNGNHQINIMALSGELRDGSEGPCGCMDPLSGSFSPTATVNAPSNCEYYGCTDSAAPNYLPIATLDCTDPTAQEHAGAPCMPCVYGVIDSMYTPAFCMPSKIEYQLDIIRKCIGTAGTASYINTITGKSDCEFKDAWKLILIEYLMSKTGLDCVYNCADNVTPDLGEMKSCEQRFNRGGYTGDIASTLSAAETRTFSINDVIKLRHTSTTPYSIYVLKSLPAGLGGVLTVEGPGGNNNHITYNPYSSIGSLHWKLCEEPPSKPTTEDYIGKFTTFVQNYCRQCQLPVGPSEAEATTEIESVITVNGIIITVNNSDLK